MCANPEVVFVQGQIGLGKAEREITCSKASLPLSVRDARRVIAGLVFGVACCVVIAIPRSSGLLAQTQAGVGRAPSEPFEVPSWMFPFLARPPGAVFDSVTRLHLPRSRRAFTAAQVRDRFKVPDWYPAAHPTMPNVVSNGRKPAVIACGYCHLPDGAGRPENAMLAGLPAAYIVQQMADIKTRARHAAWQGPFPPSDLMRTIADSATNAEVAAAARYFSRLPPRQRARVVETTSIPRSRPALGLYVLAPEGGREPLGQRLIEMPVDESRHDLRDPGVEYIAYVPPGSIARGRVLATTETPGGIKSCTNCHGPQLRGLGVVPPIAGRSPSYILRQLVAFRTGSRSAPASAPMRDVAATLKIDDMIAAAAYVGSRKP